VSDVIEQAVRARVAARELAVATRGVKDRALLATAEALEAAGPEILAANSDDVARAWEAGTSASMVDRLTLTPARIAGCAAGLRQLAALPDPVGDVVRGSTLANGLEMRQIRVPFGVVGMVYEARPNVTVDAFGIGMKSGNAMLLRGSASAASSNAAIVAVLRTAVAGAGLPADIVQAVSAESRDTVKELLHARGYVDLVIPRGGAALIRTVVEEATVPVIETGVGVTHLYVDADADLDMALDLVVDGKTTRPSVCNSLETLLVHRDVAAEFLPRLFGIAAKYDVSLHGDEDFVSRAESVGAQALSATDEDWGDEYLSLDLAARVVDSYDDALAHVRQWSSLHTEVICTNSLETARRWVADVDAAAVMVNASSRFTDGEMFGFGAEIGISTQKLHARGPMGLQELTTTKFVVTGTGQVRG
jgi:glutamate-5-semialdehyde dehydrogenase